MAASYPVEAAACLCGKHSSPPRPPTPPVPPPSPSGFMVYAGCSTPPSAPRAVHYSDPVNGSLSGDGSQAHPWPGLETIVAANLFSTTPPHYDPVTHMNVPANPNAPIKPGDTVYLLNGDHGNVFIQGSFGAGLIGYSNNPMISILAAPGSAPILDTLFITGGAGWAFQGLTIGSVNNTGKYPAFGNNNPDVLNVYFQGPHNNIIVDNNIIQTIPPSTASGWTMNQWLTGRRSGIKNVGGVCTAITNNTIRNVGNGIVSQQGSSTLIYQTLIDHFFDDGIDYADTGMLIQGNFIKNSEVDGDGVHSDGMQAQPASETTVVQNITITGNTIIRLADPSLPFPQNLQGIDQFDGVYKNVLVQNNSIVTSALQGIAYYGTQGLTVFNNTVAGDAGLYIPCLDLNLTAAQCAVQPAGYYPHAPSLTVTKSKAPLLAPAAGVTVTNNVLAGVGITVETTGLLFANNLCLPLPGATTCGIGYPVSGTEVYQHIPGTTGRQNVIPTFDATAFFTTFDTTNDIYNLTPKIPNPAQP